MADNLFYGTRKNIYDYLEILRNSINIFVCEDPKDISILTTLMFDESEIVCVCTTIKNYDDIKNFFKGKTFCCEKIEKAKHIDERFILNAILEKNNLNIDDDKKFKLLELAKLESLNSIIYKYKILGDIDLIEKVVGKIDKEVIYYLRSTYYKLITWKKKNFLPEFGLFNNSIYQYLKYIILKSEMSFKKTGLSCYPYYVQCIIKIIKFNKNEKKNYD